MTANVFWDREKSTNFSTHNSSRSECYWHSDCLDHLTDRMRDLKQAQPLAIVAFLLHNGKAQHSETLSSIYDTLL